MQIRTIVLGPRNIDAVWTLSKTVRDAWEHLEELQKLVYVKVVLG
jgi:hypothetical protein